MNNIFNAIMAVGDYTLQDAALAEYQEFVAERTRQEIALHEADLIIADLIAVFASMLSNQGNSNLVDIAKADMDLEVT